MIQHSLRPLTIGQIIDRAARLYRGQFWTYWSILAVVQIPIAILSLFVVYFTFDNLITIFEDPTAGLNTNNPFGLNIASSLNNLLSLFVLQFANSALCVVVAEGYLGGKMTIGEAFGRLRTRWQSIAGVSILSLAFMIGLFIVTLIAILTLLGWLAGIGALLFYTWVVFPLVIPAIMLEGQSAWTAIGRAWRLAKPRFWTLIWWVIVLSLLILAVQAGIQGLLFTVLGATIFEGAINQEIGNTEIWAVMGVTIGSVLVGLFINPLRATAMTLIYFDLRVRLEGLDLAAQSSDLPLFELLETAPRGKNVGRVVKWGDFGRFFLFGLGFFLLIIAIYLILIALAAAIIFSTVGGI